MQLFTCNYLKQFTLLTTLALFSSCDKKPKKNVDKEPSITVKTERPQIDSSLKFQYILDFKDKNIKNKSTRKIDVLFNGVDNYLGGVENKNISFKTEWMRGQPVQVYNGNLLFAKQLLITPDHIEYFKNKIAIPDTANRLHLISDEGERKKTQFNFLGGKGTINYVGISCNDADFNKVRLTFKSGDIIVDSLINATFFEYDLDANGEKEQYLLGYRNCNKEFVLLRTRN